MRNTLNPLMTKFVADWHEMLREQLDYRELLFQMVKRDLLLRYKQTIMGFGWAVFMPLINTVVFSVIFTRVAPLDTPVPYPLYSYCGLWAWNFFAASLRFCVVSLSGNQSLVGKVYFPREIFPFSAIAVCLVDAAVGAIPLVALMAYYHVVPSASILLLPAVILVHVAFTAAVGLILAVANLFYRDVKYLFELVVTVWMFATSVLYPLDSQTVGPRLAMIVRFNPMTPIIDGYRATILGVTLRDPVGFAIAAALSCVLLAWAWRMFHRSEFEFAENL
jgi:ABC-type polysaccharide/polyol phosphate export permease